MAARSHSAAILRSCMSLLPPPSGQGLLSALVARLKGFWGGPGPDSMHGQHAEQLNSILDELPGEQGASEQPAGDDQTQRLYGEQIAGCCCRIAWLR